MNDSNTPLELDDLSKSTASSRRSPVTGILIATLLGSASAFALFFLVFGGFGPGETPEADSQTASAAGPEADSSPKSSESIQHSSNEEANPANPIEDSNAPGSEPSVADESLEDQSVEDVDELKQASEPAVQTTAVSSRPPKMPEMVDDFKLGEPVNLLDQIDPQQHAVLGSWKLENDLLVSAPSGITCLVWPYKLPSDYILRIRLRRVTAKDTFYIKAGWDAHSTDLVLNGWHSTIGGLHLLDGRDASNPNNPTQFLSPMIGTDKPSDVTMIVYEDSIRVTIDGTTVIDWSGAPESLSIAHKRVPKLEGSFWMGTVRTSWEVSHLSLVPIKGRTRSAVPDKKQIAAAEEAIEKRMDLDFRRVRNSEKLETARKLHAASPVVEDSAERYVLFSRALEFASEAGDLKLPMTLCETLAEEYDVSLSELQFDAIEEISKVRRDPVSSYQLSVYVTNLAWRSADGHNYSEAGRFVDDAFDLAKRSRIASLIEQIGEIRKQFESWKSSYQKAADAHQAVAEGKGTQDDYLEWGKFLTLNKQDWKEGLQMLAKGGSGGLAEAARVELQEPRQFPEVIALIEKWLAAAEQFQNEEQRTLIAHAHEVAVKAYPLAEDDERLVLQQHFRELFETQKLWTTRDEPKGIAIGGERANPPQEATIELWVRTTDRDGGCLHKRVKENFGTIAIAVAGGRAELAVNASKYIERKRSDKIVSDGQWHHLAATRMGTRMQLFVDGELSAEIIARDDFPKPNSGPWTLGDFLGVQLTGEFARMRVSSVCRYHARFIPDRRYGADPKTLMLW